MALCQKGHTFGNHTTVGLFVFAIWCCLFALSMAQPRCPVQVNAAIARFYREKRRVTQNEKMKLVHGEPIDQKCKFLHKTLRSTFVTMMKSNTCGKLCQPKAKVKRLKKCQSETTKCNAFAKYRTADGSCNNLDHPSWGKSGMPQGRFVGNAYRDGKSKPRIYGCDRKKLPSPRSVSNDIHRTNGNTRLEKRISLMTMSMGQAIAHEVVITPVHTKPNGDALDCCGVDSQSDLCFNINVAQPDKFGACMPFPRSIGKRSCKTGVTDPINDQTPLLDGSHIYGPTLQIENILRDKTKNKGLMAINYGKLPISKDDASCDLEGKFDTKNNYCTDAGDIRSTEQPVLTCMHTMFIKEHNRLAIRLAKVNPTWNDERLFQEAKKINVAQLQHIIFKEYLPIVVGKRAMKYAGIDIKYRPLFRDTYNRYVNPTAMNSFTTGVLRFGHSSVPNKFGRRNADFKKIQNDVLLRKTFFIPTEYHANGIDGWHDIVRWYLYRKSPTIGHKVDSAIRDHLFEDGAGNAFDLIALNLNRGRDHGLPGYNAFRRFCKLRTTNRFSRLKDIPKYLRRRYKKLYRCVDDIDLYTGAISEKPAYGAIVGPLLQCLIIKQFKILRDGDRFFYERPNKRTGFSYAQLREIKKVRMSSIICATTNSKKVQKNAFLRMSSRNRFINCKTLKHINLSKWRDVRARRG